MTTPAEHHSRQDVAFTIVELLTVVAIVAILAGILIPTTQSARTAANRARTRVQFSQWAAAFETYKQEYGAYPAFAGAAGAGLINQAAANAAASAHPFHDTLAGRHRDGSPLADTEAAAAENPRRLRFIAFAEADFVRQEDVDAGRNQLAELNLLRDAFHNTSLAIVIDANLDGLITAADIPGNLPAVSVPGADIVIRPNVQSLLRDGVATGVIFYCTPPGGRGESELLCSWK